MKLYKKSLAILSGGLDSCTATAIALSQSHSLAAVHFDYFQLTQEAERRAFVRICDALNITERFIIPMDFFTRINAGALLGVGEVGRAEIGHNEASGELPATYVPFRNGIFFSIAAAIAQSIGAQAIYSGIVQEDASAYPDTTAAFAASAEAFIRCGSGTDIKIESPLLGKNKSEAIQIALELNAPLHLSHSCYVSNDAPCNTCESCRLRARAFERLSIKDPALI